MLLRSPLVSTFIAGGALLAGCTAETVGDSTARLEPVCVEVEAGAPEGAWICPEDRVIECDGGDGTASIDFVYVPADRIVIDGAATPVCGDVHLAVDDPGPYAVGTHEVGVQRLDPFGIEAPLEICRMELTVEDTTPPEAVPLEPAPLWPPNHRMERVTVDDCVEVTDACDPDVDVFFVSATSDEPADGRGDGHHAPDIRADGCDAVLLRAERQGGGDGRVYTLGWRAVDDAGHAVEGTCRVEVPHDQSGRAAVDGGVAHSVDLPCGP